MENVLRESFVPYVMVSVSPECTPLYDHPLFKSKAPIKTSSGLRVKLCKLPQIASNKSHLDGKEDIDVETMANDLKSSNPSDFYHSIVTQLVQKTYEPEHSHSFETFGHPVASILVVSSTNPSPISALTQLYQQSYFDCPPGMSADFLRCVWYVHNNEKTEDEQFATTEDFATVSSQFGPHCFEVADFDKSIEDAVSTVTTHSIYPYLHRIVKEWQSTNTNKNTQSGFGFGKFLKKLVTSGPPRPEVNVFFEVCREMQPHVASIPARRRPGSPTHLSVDVDMQLRRLADVAFMLGEYKLAYSAYDSLRKPFTSEQRWAPLGGCSEMAAIASAYAGLGDVGAAVDTALYTYNSRLHLPSHALRCVLVVCGCLVEFGDQLLAAGLLSTALLEIDPMLGSGNCPGETAMIMERISIAFEKRGWRRKSRLWSMLADREWQRVVA